MQSRSSSPAAELSVPGTVPPDMHYLIPSQLGNADAMVFLLVDATPPPSYMIL